MTVSAREKESRLPNVIGFVLALTVFPLIWVGGLVTTFDAGMAVPDWPNTYNYNMFAYPVRDWFFGPWDLFVEHGHRLLASLAGLIAIGLVCVTCWKDRRPWVRWLSVAILVLIIVQGLLGGIRVLQMNRMIAKVHGCLGPAFFALVCVFCVATSNWWREHQRAKDRKFLAPINRSSMMVQLSIVMLLLSFIQLVFGAFLRHIDISSPPGFYQQLVVFHVLTAIVIVGGTVFQLYLSRGRQYRSVGVRGSINLVVILVFVQFGLGLATWVIKFGWPVWFDNMAFAAQFVVPEKSFLQMNLITAHVAAGTLILALWAVHCAQCQRVMSSGWRRRSPAIQSNNAPLSSGT